MTSPRQCLCAALGSTLVEERTKGSPKNVSFDKLGLLDQPGGGGLTEDQLFCKIVKTKLTFVNGQKCDETHNT